MKSPDFIFEFKGILSWNGHDNNKRICGYSSDISVLLAVFKDFFTVLKKPYAQGVYRFGCNRKF
mgnify:CR=1 FL=1